MGGKCRIKVREVRSRRLSRGQEIPAGSFSENSRENSKGSILCLSLEAIGEKILSHGQDSSSKKAHSVETG